MDLETCGYAFELEPTLDNRLGLAGERVWSNDRAKPFPPLELGAGHLETWLGTATSPIAEEVRRALAAWKVFHFHDTSDTALAKQVRKINDNEYLRPDASNLAAFLLAMQQRDPQAYQAVRETVRLAMPAFDDFVLRPTAHDPTSIQLEWRERDSDYPFLGHQFSDGTLRFACLAALLLQPSPPATIVIDEPEPGLHPHAVSLLTGMLRSVSTKTQLIVATQSAVIVDRLSPDQVIVVDRRNGASTFTRQDAARLKPWLEDYSLGELWEKSVIGGGPSR